MGSRFSAPGPPSPRLQRRLRWSSVHLLSGVMLVRGLAAVPRRVSPSRAARVIPSISQGWRLSPRTRTKATQHKHPDPEITAHHLLLTVGWLCVGNPAVPPQQPGGAGVLRCPSYVRMRVELGLSALSSGLMAPGTGTGLRGRPLGSRGRISSSDPPRPLGTEPPPLPAPSRQVSFPPRQRQ